MPGLRDIVQGLSKREGVEAVVVVSGDGLPIDQASNAGLDGDAVAALVATVAHGARRLGRAVNYADLSTGVLEFGPRMVVFSALSQDNLLLVLLAPETNAGALLYDLRRHGPAIAELL